jgi:N-methylhydantoinase A/oxoprolinase/acetone carboxylase beta subunit
VAFGFIKVANEAMCRPIRALTQGKGYNAAGHILACFGGAVSLFTKKNRAASMLLLLLDLWAFEHC